MRNYSFLAGTSSAGSDQYNRYLLILILIPDIDTDFDIDIDRNYEVTAQSQEQYNATLNYVKERDYSKVKYQKLFHFKFNFSLSLR